MFTRTIFALAAVTLAYSSALPAQANATLTLRSGEPITARLPDRGTPVPAAGTGIVVPGRQPWTSAGLNVRRGEVFNFNTTGEIQLSGDAADLAGSAGSKSGRYAPNAALPRSFAGALIGRIGNGPAFAIGNQATITMPASGRLFLGVNDDAFDDNLGEFRVEITRARR